MTPAPASHRTGVGEEAAGSGRLLARILHTPDLAQAVARLPPEVFYRVVQTCGLEDCGELVALATPEQLTTVFDVDLWRPAPTGLDADERFDAARFCRWLEVLVDQGAAIAARTVAAIDATLVTAALSERIAVYDPAVATPLTSSDDDMIDGPVAPDRLRCEVGGYLVVARRTDADAWDAIVAVLQALDQEDHDRFHHIMRRCRTLSNSTPEIDGLHDLLTDAEQIRFDLSYDRERRRERQGYVTPAQARAFLRSSRQLRLDAGGAPPGDHIAAAYFRAHGWGGGASGAPASSRSGEADAPAPASQAAGPVTALVGLLADAGVLPGPRRALLEGAPGPASGFVLFREQMDAVRDRDPGAYAIRSEELAFLANVLVAGCSIQARPFTPREASDCAVATCNLGLENWPRLWVTPRAGRDHSRDRAASGLPDGFLGDHDLVTVFQVGWTVLHERVCLHVAGELIHLLEHVRCHDRAIQAGLDRLRHELTTHWRAAEPWQARHALDVLAMLDLAAWAALVELMAECPVMLANVHVSGRSRVHSVAPSVFEFVAENTHVASVHAFMRSLPDALSR